MAVSTVVWWLVIAAVIGALMYPASARLRTHMPTGVALVLLIVVVLGAAGWLGFRGLSEVKDQSRLGARLGRATNAQQIEASPQYGETAKRVGLTEQGQRRVRQRPRLVQRDLGAAGHGQLLGRRALLDRHAVAAVRASSGPSSSRGAVGQFAETSVAR